MEETRENKFIFRNSVKIPGNTSGLRERLISNGGWGYNRRDSATITLMYLKTWNISYISFYVELL